MGSSQFQKIRPTDKLRDKYTILGVLIIQKNYILTKLDLNKRAHINVVLL